MLKEEIRHVQVTIKVPFVKLNVELHNRRSVSVRWRYTLASADSQLLAVQLLDGRQQRAQLLVLEEHEHIARGHQLVQVRQQRVVDELMVLDQEQHASSLDAHTLEHLFERRGEGLAPI